MLDCTTDKYHTLYARWLTNPGTLLDAAGWEPGMTLLDLCGGPGIVTRAALRRGAKPEDITLVDLNPRAEDTGVRQVTSSMENLHLHMEPADWERYDVAVMRQAIGYIDINSSFPEKLRQFLKPGGVFAFNTFRKPRFAYRAYNYGGTDFVELSGYLGRTVLHLQAAPGVGWDLTRFHWHKPDELLEAFGKYDVTVKRRGRSIHFICVRV